MTHEEKIAAIKNLIKSGIAANKFMNVSFIKKDGTLRNMQVRRSKVLEANVKGTQPEATEARRSTLKARNMLCVEELVKPGTNEFQWRTINMETVKRIAVDGKVHEFA